MKKFIVRILLTNLLIKISEQNHIINNYDIQKYQDASKSNQSPITYIQQLKSVERHFDSMHEKSFFKQPKLSKSSRESLKAASNQELFNVLGFQPSKLFLNRKRLAYFMSKNHYQPDNSRIFIIKLPPNYKYYADSNVKFTNDIGRNEMIPLGFISNGRPAAIYHWNLPIVENLLQLSIGRVNKVSDSPEALIDTTGSLLEAKETFNDNNDDRKELRNIKNKSVQIYYAPGNHLSTKSIYTNGKPKSFYILKKDNETQQKELIKLT